MRDLRTIKIHTIGLQERDGTDRAIRVYADNVFLGSAVPAEGVILDITKQRGKTVRPERVCTVLSPLEALDLASRLQAVALQYLTLKD